MKKVTKKLIEELQKGGTISKSSSGNIMAILKNDKIIPLEAAVLEKLLKDDIIEEIGGPTINRTTGEEFICYRAKDEKTS